jgi:hypothetical protein
LLCAILLFASGPTRARSQQPGELPPPPPRTGDAAPRSPSDLDPLQTPGKGFAPPQAPTQQAPLKQPMQAPLQAQAPQVVTCTVMVPQISYKTITVPQIVCTPEVRQQQVQVCRMVPETKMVNVVETVMTPERRVTTQPYTVCRMEMQTVTRNVTVLVPQVETRQGVRTVCRPVAVQEMQTVCRDLGGYQTQSFVDCCGCVQTCQVYVPNIVTEQRPVTVMKPQFVEEPFTYQAVTCRPETRTITEQIPKPVYETKTREVSYVVGVPRQIERQVPQTTLRPVMETKTVNYTALVPREVQKQVTVPVCTMVPKQVSYTLPACPPCAACGW